MKFMGKEIFRTCQNEIQFYVPKVSSSQARKIAQKSTALKLGRMSQDNSYYIFGYAEEVDISPIGVNKETGEVIEYFPPDHYEEFKNAKEVDSTVI